MSGHTWPMYLAHVSVSLAKAEAAVSVYLPHSDAGAGLMAQLPIFTFIRHAPM